MTAPQPYVAATTAVVPTTVPGPRSSTDLLAVAVEHAVEHALEAPLPAKPAPLVEPWVSFRLRARKALSSGTGATLVGTLISVLYAISPQDVVDSARVIPHAVAPLAVSLLTGALVGVRTYFVTNYAVSEAGAVEPTGGKSVTVS